MSIKFAGTAFIIFIVFFIGGMITKPLWTEDTIVATVRKTERVHTKNDSYYIVFTDKESMSLKDDWIHGNFSSSDLYAELEEGKTYKFYVSGWRIPFLSAYRNIYNVKQID
jgi:hypothetical protein